MKSLILALLLAQPTIISYTNTGNPPASEGWPPMPPPAGTPYATNPTPYIIEALAVERQTVLVPNGKWQIVCQNYKCEATNIVFPLGTNVNVIPMMGGRNIEYWLMVKCPTCNYTFSNLFHTRWSFNIPPVPVVIRTNLPTPAPSVRYESIK